MAYRNTGKNNGGGLKEASPEDASFEDIISSSFTPEEIQEMERKGTQEADSPAPQYFAPVDNVYDREAEPDTENDLQNAEDAGFTYNQNPGEKKENSALKKLQPSTTSPEQENSSDPKGGRLRQLSRKGRQFMSQKKAVTLGVSVGSIIAIFLVFFFIIVFIGPLKGIHFNTVLRSVGFAAFQRTMGRSYAQTVFDRAVLMDSSTGRLTLKNGATGWSASRLRQLGNDNKLRWDIDSGNKVRGIEIDGRLHSMDESMKALGFEGDFDRLPRSKRWQVISHFNNNVREGMTSMLADKNLVYRTTVMNSFRKITGISMFRWPDRAKAYLSKKPAAARVLNITDTKRAINATKDFLAGRIFSGDAEERAKDIDRAAEAGKATRSTRPPKWLADLNTGARAASLAAMASTVICLIHEIDQAITAYEAEAEGNAARMGHDSQTVLDQMTSGDTVSEAVNAESERWYGAESACGYQQDIGADLQPECIDEVGFLPPIYPSNVPLYQTIMMADTFIHTGNLPEINGVQIQFGPSMADPTTFGRINQLPNWATSIQNNASELAYDGLCRVVLNEFVQYAVASAEVVLAVVTANRTSGAIPAIWTAIKAAAGFVTTMKFGDWLGTQIDEHLKMISGTPYSGSETGADAYNQTKLSVGLLESVASHTVTFGAPLSNQQSTDSEVAAVKEMRDDYNSRGFTEKYFAIENPFSLLGQTVARMPDTPSSLISGIMGYVRGALTAVASPFKLLSSLMGFASNAAFAAGSEEVDLVLSRLHITPGNAGVVDWGYTENELQKISTDESFETSELTSWIEPQIEELDAKYMICYPETDFMQSKLAKAHPECFDYSDAGLLKSEEALRWRWYHSLLASQVLIDTDLEEYNNPLDLGGTSTGFTAAYGDWAKPNPPAYGRITQGFGVGTKYGPHTGVDLAGSGQSEPVFAACSGKVLHIVTNSGQLGYQSFGESTLSNFIVLDCGDNVTAGYHHTLPTLGLQEGQLVSAGQEIGKTDASGNWRGWHLHFTIKQNGVFVDPVAFMAGKGITLP